jgi:hypothetical protein
VASLADDLVNSEAPAPYWRALPLEIARQGDRWFLWAPVASGSAPRCTYR